MADLRTTAVGFSQYLARELDIDARDAEVIRYGLEIILGSLIKGATIIGVSYLLGITPYVLTALGTSSVLRLLSGGAHCSSYSRCLVFGSAISVVIGSLAPVAGPYFNGLMMLVLIMFTALTGLFFVNRWAPADTPGKPIKRPEKRERFRKYALLYVVVWNVALTLFVLLRGAEASSLSLALASAGGLLAQVVSLSPAGYRLIGRIDDGLSKILP